MILSFLATIPLAFSTWKPEDATVRTNSLQAPFGPNTLMPNVGYNHSTLLITGCIEFENHLMPTLVLWVWRGRIGPKIFCCCLWDIDRLAAQLVQFANKPNGVCVCICDLLRHVQYTEICNCLGWRLLYAEVMDVPGVLLAVQSLCPDI